MLLDGLRHHRQRTFGEGVVAAHGALQLGKLADHVGQQVGLGEQRGPVGQVLVGAQQAGNLARHDGHALNPVAEGAELVVIDHAIELDHAGGEASLDVLLEEETRIRQTRTHHALVTGDDVRRVFELHVGDDQEAVEQLAVGGEEREILLVRAHRQDQAFLRHRQELGFELAHVHRGMFDQRGHLVEQVGVLAEAGVQQAGFGDELLLDVGATFGEVGNHLAFGQQGRLVGVGTDDVDIAAAHEAVALGRTAGLDVEHAARHHVGAMQHGQLVGRTHEGGVAVAPAHHLGNRQRLEGVLHDAAKHLGKQRAGHGAGVEQGLGLAIHAALEAGYGRQGNALGFELLGQGRGGLAIGAQGHRHRHDLLGHVLRRRGGQHVGHGHRQTARGGEPAELTVGGDKATGTQAGNDSIGESLAEFRQGLGGQLFGEQFNEQGRAGHHAASFLSIGKPRASREL